MSRRLKVKVSTCRHVSVREHLAEEQKVCTHVKDLNEHFRPKTINNRRQIR